MAKTLLITSKKYSLSVMLQFQLHNWFAVGLWHLPYIWSLSLGYFAFTIGIFPFGFDEDDLAKLQKEGVLKLDVG